jgi:hypothetical protein
MTPSSALAILGLLGLGLIVLLGSALAGGEQLERLVTPPSIVRAALVGAMTIAAVACGRAALERFRAAGAGRPGGAHLAQADPIVMLRGIRLAFLALAALAAGTGWLLGHALPLVVAAIIAAVDVIETSFLLLVVAVRGGPSPGPASDDAALPGKGRR